MNLLQLINLFPILCLFTFYKLLITEITFSAVIIRYKIICMHNLHRCYFISMKQAIISLKDNTIISSRCVNFKHASVIFI